jgi:hypothetical protein
MQSCRLVARFKNQSCLTGKQIPIGPAEQLVQGPGKLRGPWFVSVNVPTSCVADEGRHGCVVEEQSETIPPLVRHCCLLAADAFSGQSPPQRIHSALIWRPALFCD